MIIIIKHTYTWEKLRNYNNNDCIQRRSSRFFTISSLCRELSLIHTLKQPGHNRVQIMCNRMSTYHVQCVVCHWVWRTAQLLSLTELKLHLFELYFISWTIKLMKEGRKLEYPEKTPDDELQKMPHTTARRLGLLYWLKPLTVEYCLIACANRPSHYNFMIYTNCDDDDDV